MAADQQIRVNPIATPKEAPLSLAQVKKDRVVSHNEHDDILQQCLDAAVAQAERITGRALMPRPVRQIVTWPEAAELPLSVWPVQQITSVSVDGQSVDLNETESILGDDDPVIAHPGFAHAKRVDIEYNAGYANAEVVPANIKKWLLLAIGSMYEHRESEVIGTITTKLKYADGLLGSYKIRRYE